jgi:cell division protein FtsW (lipid II flippase)
MSSVTASSGAAVPDEATMSPEDARARQSRRSELLMLAFAIGVMLFAFVNVKLGMKGIHFSTLITYVVAFAVVMLFAHLAIRRWAPYADPLLLPLAAVLNGLGIVFLYRLQEAGRVGNPPSNTPISTLTSSATVMQIMYSVVGIGCMAAVLIFVKESRVLQRYTYTLGIAGMVLIALPALLPASISEVQGAKIQIRLGSFSLQPEEFAKICLAIFFAGYLVSKRDVLKLAGRRVLGIDLPRGRDLGPILVIWAVALLLLVFESDIGTSSLFMGLFVAMLYLATSRTSWLLIGFVLFIVGALLAAQLFSHVAERFDIWLHPYTLANLNGNSYQLAKGLEGLGYGGVLGRGLGGGMPYLTPLVQSDMVTTGFGEELGLAGLMAILLIYGLIAQRGLRAALQVKDPFSKLLAGGLAFMIAMQVFVIVGGASRLIPLTGITTPFLSQGGSSLIASWIIIAIFARISDTARRPPPRPIQEEGMTQVVRLQ